MAQENEGAAGAGESGQAGAATLTSEQLHAAIEKARLDERTKLRTELDTLTTKATQAEELSKTEAARVEALELKLKALEAGLVEGDKGKTVDVGKAIEQATNALAERMSKENGKKLEEMNKRLQELQAEAATLKRRELRDSLINAAGGQTALIPELVKGETEEEIKQSIEQSKAIFARTVQRAGSGNASQNTAANDGTSGAGSGAAGIPSLPNAQAGAAGQPTSVRGWTMDEYAKNRTKLKSQAAQRYPQTIMVG